MDIDIATFQPAQKAAALAPPYLTTFGVQKEEEKEAVAGPAPAVVVLKQWMMNWHFNSHYLFLIFTKASTPKSSTRDLLRSHSTRAS
jgi:hypothetical protein